jgi:outer membrane scaffolding protein for murein synthesis (MipA/OmpV family)
MDMAVMRWLEPAKCAALLTTVAVLAASPRDAAAEDFTGGLMSGGDINLAVGGIAVITPRFEGSKQYRVIGFPYVMPAGMDDGKSRLSVRSPDDVRFRLFELQGFEFGPLAGWRFGRDQNDADHLAGLGDIDGGLVVGAYAGYHIGVFMPFISYHHQVTGSDTGGVLRFGVEATARVLPWVTLTAIAGSSYADGAYMESFFGVTAAQSAASTLATFDAGSGIKDVYINLSGDFRLDDRWTLKLGGRYARLVGDAADSPIVESRDQFQAVIGLSYKFTVPGF